MPRRRTIPQLLAVLAALLVLTACGGSGGGEPGSGGGSGPGNGSGDGPGAGASQSSGPADGYKIKVRDGDGPVHTLDAAALRALPTTDVKTPQSGGKKVQHGPLVRTVLGAAGVTDFTRLEVVSLDGTATFSAAQIGDDVVLDFNHRGTTKLAGTRLPTSKWQRDITELDAEP